MPDKIRLTVLGYERLSAALNQVTPRTQQRVDAAIEKTAEMIAYRAKSRVKKRTGRLAEKISHTFNAKTGTAEVGVARGAFHGHFLEFGTVEQPAQPFLLPAVEEEDGPAQRRYQEALSQVERDLSAGGLT